MEEYKKRLSLTLVETGALFFDKGLILKDGRPTPYFVNLGKFCTGRLLLEMGSFFSDMLVNNSLADRIDIIVGPSYKGSAIASATASALFQYHGHDLLFDYDRKEAKRHGEGSSSAAYFVNNTFFDGCRAFHSKIMESSSVGVLRMPPAAGSAWRSSSENNYRSLRKGIYVGP